MRRSQSKKNDKRWPRYASHPLSSCRHGLIRPICRIRMFPFNAVDECRIGAEVRRNQLSRIAVFGSTDIARRAGNHDANNVIPSSTNPTTENVGKSNDVTPNARRVMRPPSGKWKR